MLMCSSKLIHIALRIKHKFFFGNDGFDAPANAISIAKQFYNVQVPTLFQYHVFTMLGDVFAMLSDVFAMPSDIFTMPSDVFDNDARLYKKDRIYSTSYYNASLQQTGFVATNCVTC